VGSRIVFAGSPEFAVPSLNQLVGSGHEIVGVLTRPDRPAGRGRSLRPGPVKTAAAGFDLDIMQPEDLVSGDIEDRLRSLQPDLMVVVAYGLLLPATVLGIPRAGCINVHASILPRWRGASPVQAAILAGDPVSGVSLMQMEEGLDTGPVYAVAEIPIGERETAGELERRLAEAGAGLLAEAIDGILDGSSVPRAQDDAGATYAGRISKSDAVIDWSAPATEIDRRIRAYNPWPVAETSLDGQRLRCWAAVGDEAAGEPAGAGADPGQIVGAGNGTVDVQTGEGILRLAEVQLPGRKRMPAAEFARGYALVGKILG
jgi:methionyl-tRNA formyltransferase